MFVMYYPFLITAGRVYKAVPPLYSIKEGKKIKYFTENIDLIKYNQKLFLDNNEFLDAKKNKIENKDITKFFLANSDYIYYLEKVANTYAVDPYLLELVLYNYISNKHSINMDKLKKEVTSTYRFMDVMKQKDKIIVKGSIDKSNLIIISDSFIYDCRFIIDILDKNNDIYYTLNKKKTTIYAIMKVYESYITQIQRYKGLGEMGDGQLGESTMLPDNRTLIKYTMEDAKECIHFIREYESNPKKILSEVQNVTRDDLIE